eukprot:TRINITY_DN4240_c0_g1_i2.p1 TRINITY_DN4240_c0_g1~~TRINITY_DN4240_c0_g1_i2.p1  ORF type:complete len:144 (-),score=44.06 TRINITY_DN4240_c0_g1_i2:200-631(-)
MECCSACDSSAQTENITAVAVQAKQSVVKEEIKEEVKEPAPAPEPQPAAAEPAATPVRSIKFSFELPDKTTVEIDFKERPIGIDFRRTAPMTVKGCKPNTPAEEMKVGADWLLTHVDGEKLPDDFNKIMEVIGSKVGTLPERK